MKSGLSLNIAFHMGEERDGKKIERNFFTKKLLYNINFLTWPISEKTWKKRMDFALKVLKLSLTAPFIIFF